MAMKSPLFSQDGFQKVFIAAAWNSVYPVIGSHDSLHISIFHTGLKRRQVCLPQILF